MISILIPYWGYGMTLIDVWAGLLLAKVRPRRICRRKRKAVTDGD